MDDLTPGTMGKVVAGPFAGLAAKVVVRLEAALRVELVIAGELYVVELRPEEFVPEERPGRRAGPEPAGDGAAGPRLGRRGRRAAQREPTRREPAPGCADPAAREDELERCIDESPDDDDAYLVYGDWLQGRGDPRGTLIALQARPELREEAEAFLEEHADYFLGPLQDSEGQVSLAWRNGYIESATVSLFDGGVERLRELLRLPSARFLRGLELIFFEDEGYYEPELGAGGALEDFDAELVEEAIEALHEAEPRLARLALLDTESWDSWADLGDLSWGFNLLPGLKELRIGAGRLSLDHLYLPALRRLRLETPALRAEHIEALAGAFWSSLEELSLTCGASFLGAKVEAFDLLKLASGERTPALRHLGLTNAEFADELCEHLLGAGVLRRLESLDLSQGIMTDEGAQVLRRNKKRFEHLRLIDLRENYLTEEGVALVRQLGPVVRVEGQREPDYYEFQAGGVFVEGPDEDGYVSNQVMNVVIARQFG